MRRPIKYPKNPTNRQTMPKASRTMTITKLTPRSLARVSFQSTEIMHRINDIPFEEAEPQSPMIINAVLEEGAARKLINDQRASLKTLVIEQGNSLSNLSNHTNNQSLRSIISDKLSRSSKKLDCSITEQADSFSEFNWLEDGHSISCFEEEQRMWDSVRLDEEGGGDESSETPEPVGPEERGISQIEVTPGVFMPIRGYSETWQAIKQNCTTTTLCTSCKEELHVIEDAAHVVCPDCWMVTTMDQSIGVNPLEFDGESDSHGVGMGIKAEDLLKWVKEQE
jgi:hypothetical protein